MRTIKMKKTLPILNREEMNSEANELLAVKRTMDWSPEELTRIWQNTSG